MQSRVVKEIAKSEAGIIEFSSASQGALAADKGRDEPAFETLVKQNRPKIFSLALRYTRVREDAEDVVQQTFQKAFLHLQKFAVKSSLSTWLTRIAINEALMLLRRSHALREVSLDDSRSDGGATSTLEIIDASSDPEAKYLEREAVGILYAAMGRFTPGIRAASELPELGELTNRETARRMGLSLSAVKARVFHGRRKLREKLKHYMRSVGARPAPAFHSFLAHAAARTRALTD